MSRKDDINRGATTAAFVVAALAGLVTWSLPVGCGTFAGLCVLLGALRVVR